MILKCNSHSGQKGFENYCKSIVWIHGVTRYSNPIIFFRSFDKDLTRSRCWTPGFSVFGRFCSMNWNSNI